ncbi:hypothetical protein [Elizabethkingia anophelis]|uniref:hypothetical protein n=1 Tax=Elizabethkingia anophelis TaxID=1117645 RepID=UPI0023E9DF8F|nr:hypothetical protein [Elizabethkingia anophelis]GJN62050.1 hypothetical protein ELAK_22000 [Elizabethkingia anophelis]HDP3253298.1 hypothetical protein [Elizabethkingia anophelis]
MRIGLVGEAPNDTEAIQKLLEKKYSNLNFFFMLQRVNGSNLDSQKIKRFLRIEFETQKPDVVIFIRDLDAVLPNREKLSKRKEYFRDVNRVVNKKGIFFLNIYEIEALILADIGCFNRFFNVNVEIDIDVMLIEEPKEFLKSKASRYNESMNSNIFEDLSFDTVHANCKYLEGFIKKFDRLISYSGS